MFDNDSGLAARAVVLVTRTPLRVRYVAVGLTIGFTWGVQGGLLWQRPVIMSAVLLVVPPLLHLARARLIQARQRPDRTQASLLRFTVAKADLVVLAIFATWSLQPVTSYAELLVGAALAITVATLGPVLHPHMLVRSGEPDLEKVVATAAAKGG
ncbi:MAG: hypothetical protein ACRDTJ_32290 [Pseudonocardiaceae bacterium]